MPSRAKNNLNLARFSLKNKTRTGSLAVLTDITLYSVRLFHELKESEKEHIDTLVSPVIDAKNWPKSMDSLEKYFRGNIGVKGVPLSYVVISKVVVAPSWYEPVTSFSSAEDEMVARAPILECRLRTVTFKINMMKVWGMIYVITRDLDCWTSVKSAQRTIFVRKAYRDLWDHLLGPDNVDNMEIEF